LPGALPSLPGTPPLVSPIVKCTRPPPPTPTPWLSHGAATPAITASSPSVSSLVVCLRVRASAPGVSSVSRRPGPLPYPPPMGAGPCGPNVCPNPPAPDNTHPLRPTALPTHVTGQARRCHRGQHSAAHGCTCTSDAHAHTSSAHGSPQIQAGTKTRPLPRTPTQYTGHPPPPPTSLNYHAFHEALPHLLPGPLCCLRPGRGGERLHPSPLPKHGRARRGRRGGDRGPHRCPYRRAHGCPHREGCVHGCPDARPH